MNRLFKLSVLGSKFIDVLCIFCELDNFLSLSNELFLKFLALCFHLVQICVLGFIFANVRYVSVLRQILDLYVNWFICRLWNESSVCGFRCRGCCWSKWFRFSSKDSGELLSSNSCVFFWLIRNLVDEWYWLVSVSSNISSQECLMLLKRSWSHVIIVLYVWLSSLDWSQLWFSISLLRSFRSFRDLQGFEAVQFSITIAIFFIDSINIKLQILSVCRFISLFSFSAQTILIFTFKWSDRCWLSVTYSILHIVARKLILDIISIDWSFIFLFISRVSEGLFPGELRFEFGTTIIGLVTSIPTFHGRQRFCIVVFNSLESLIYSNTAMITFDATTISLWKVSRLKSDWSFVGLKLSSSIIQDRGILGPGLVGLIHSVLLPSLRNWFVFELFVVPTGWSCGSVLKYKLLLGVLGFFSILSVVSALKDRDCWWLFLVTDMFTTASELMRCW